MNRNWSPRKIAALVIFIVALALAIPAGMKLNQALKKPPEFQEVTIRQLVNGEIPAGQNVAVYGQARYGVGLEETQGGKRSAILFPLIDWNDQTLIYVRSTDLTLFDWVDGMASITGTVQSSSDDLKGLVKKDLADIQAAGIATTDSIYIEEAPVPIDPKSFWLQAGGLALVMVACLVAFAWPEQKSKGKQGRKEER